RTTRAPSRDTSGRPSSRSTAGSACPRRGPSRAPRGTTAASRPGFPRAGGDKGSSLAPIGSPWTHYSNMHARAAGLTRPSLAYRLRAVPPPSATPLVYPAFNPIAFGIGPIQVRWYGLMYLLGFLVGWLGARYRAKRADGPIAP